VTRGVRFLCAGDTSWSQLAEALARRLLPPDVLVASAGTEPRSLDPRAETVMGELGIDLEGQPSRGPGDAPLAAVEHVITLGAGAPERWPATADRPSEHWPLPDPEPTGGSPEEALGAFRAVRDDLLRRISRLAAALSPEPALGVIGGSGFYELPGLSGIRRIDVDTPFGAPSGALVVGRLAGKRVVFLARHGEGHHLLPGEVNARANVHALKRLGVTKVISVSAVGSLREDIAPGHVVLPRQFLDRTVNRPSTFFGGGVVAHVSLADPVCGGLAGALAAAARGLAAALHEGGTYLCIEGPQFGTRADSALWRSFGADVVGMTNLPEARLAREAELCYATLALPTDYDCWRTRDEEVRVDDVLAVLHANVEKARRILAVALDRLDAAAPCVCARALDAALITPPPAIGPAALVRLHAVLARRLGEVVP
jgi:5'-methylthioadenosine phosphorylase